MAEDELADSSGEELFEHFRFVIDPGQTPFRIDKFLFERIPNTSRNKIQLAAKGGFIRVGGQSVKSNYKIRSEDVVTVELPYPIRDVELKSEYIPLDIIYEDDEMIVINKQANMVVHPGYGNYTGTLVNGLVYHFKSLPVAEGSQSDRPGIVHRLDKHTTGVMVVGKTEEALMGLGKQFFDRTTTRRYRALVWGDLEEGGTITGHIGRSLKNRRVMNIFEDGDYGKHAVTHFSVIKRYGYVTLVECRLETGRTHQIRAHMKHIGHPLFNDYDYGGNKILKGTSFTKYRQFVENCFKLLPGQALHAKSLGLTHPRTGERMEFESDLPSGFQEILAKWEHYLQYRKD